MDDFREVRGGRGRGGRTGGGGPDDFPSSRERGRGGRGRDGRGRGGGGGGRVSLFVAYFEATSSSDWGF